jgi:hypothetical protein
VAVEIERPAQQVPNDREAQQAQQARTAALVLRAAEVAAAAGAEAGPVATATQDNSAESQDNAPSAEALQASVMSGLMQAMRLQSSTQPQQQSARAGTTSGGPERLQPFTEAEKVCAAYMWRGRRAQLLRTSGAIGSDSGNGNNDSRASS